MNFSVLKVVITLLLMAALPTFAASPSMKDAFIGITEKELRKQYTRLAMSPVVASSVLALPEEMKSLISTEIQALLEDEDFDILPPSTIQAINDQFTALYKHSPAPSDAVQQQRNNAIAEHAYRELFFKYPVDGLVTVQVVTVGAPFANDKASWHGTTQKIKHSGDGFLKAISGTNYGGTIHASSIKVTISNRLGAVIYHWAGGIEVLMEREGKSLKVKPASEFWQDEKRVRKAIKYALKPF